MSTAAAVFTSLSTLQTRRIPGPEPLIIILINGSALDIISPAPLWCRTSVPADTTVSRCPAAVVLPSGACLCGVSGTVHSIMRGSGGWGTRHRFGRSSFVVLPPAPCVKYASSLHHCRLVAGETRARMFHTAMLICFKLYIRLQTQFSIFRWITDSSIFVPHFNHTPPNVLLQFVSGIVPYSVPLSPFPTFAI